MTHWLAGIAAVAVGVLAWELVIPAGTTKEAWDIPAYWQASFPAMIAGAFAIGFLAPDKPTWWGLLIGLGQGVWSLAKTSFLSGVPNLLPLGLIVFAILSLPCVLAAHAGAWVSQRVRG